MRMHMCVSKYICAFFCSECYMHFTVILSTSAWADVYVTQVCFYTVTNEHICEHTRCRLCTHVYMYICVYMHACAYGCVCVSIIQLDTLRRCCWDFLSVQTCAYACVCICVCMYGCIGTCVYVCICIYICLCICMHIERDCFDYIITQTYDVGLHSRRHPMEFDAGTRPFTSFDALSS